MKILVPTKRVPDTDQRVRLSDDGIGIDEAATQFVVNPFDAIAVEEALRIREAATSTVEVVVVGIGAGDYETELRTSLAMGADRALHIECGSALDPWAVAAVLRAVVDKEQPELVLMGKQAVDDDSNQVGQFLAALLDWPQATFASRIEFHDSGLQVARETDAGIEVIRLPLPAVVTTDLRLNEPRYASLPGILQAKKKPIDRLVPADLGVEPTPRTRVTGMTAASRSRDCTFVSSPEELIDHLREGKVIT